MKGNFGVGSNPVGISLGDIDGDGDIDIAVTNYYSNNVSILINRNSTADISLSSYKLSFGDVSVGSSIGTYLVIRNDGVDSTLRVRFSLRRGEHFSVSRSELNVPGVGQDSVLVTFSPRVNGVLIDTLVLESNDPFKPVLYVVLIGYSGNYVSGVITRDSVWTRDRSPYIVNGHIGVDAGVRLRIESGVRVVFKGRYNFNVDGILEVEGVEGDSVVFTSLYPDTMRYPGIRFRSGSRGLIRYARVENSDFGIRMIQGSKLEVYGSMFERNGYGVVDSSVSEVIIRRSKFKSNGEGVRLVSSTGYVDSCEFIGNSNGISFYSSNGWVRGSSFSYNDVGVRSNGGSVEVGYNRFNGNSNGVYVDGWTYGSLRVIGNEIYSGVTGISYNWGWGNLELVDNLIRGNSGWGMYLVGVGGGYARGNYIFGNGSGVYIWEGGGVSFERNRVRENRGVGLQTNLNILIRDNEISYNDGDGINTGGSGRIESNDIVWNFGDGIETSGKPVVNYNNIYGNGGYDFRATLQASDSIDAKNNWWGTVNRDEIVGRIYDFYDDGVTVRVKFEPYLSSRVGLSAVRGFSAVGRAGGVVELSWERHSRARFYRLYYDNGSGVVDTFNVWLELDSSFASYRVVLRDGRYRFGIRAVSSSGDVSPLVYAEAISDGTAPWIVYAFGVAGDSLLSVKFSEDVDLMSVVDTSRWFISGGLGIGVVRLRNGLVARYYNFSGDTSNATLVAVDTLRDTTRINFYWGQGSPRVGVNSDNFKVVYEGLLYVPSDGNYWFRVEAGDTSFKLWIDDVLVLRGYSWSSYGEATISLRKGYHKFKLEYVEYTGEAYVRLYWRNWEIISGSNFYLPGVNQVRLVLRRVLPVSDSLVRVGVRGLRDLYGNEILESVYDFHPDDGNSNPVVVLRDIVGEVSGDVRVDYEIRDVERDSVRLRVEYSVDNGVSWRLARVVGDTFGITSDRYVGYLIWRSGLDLPGYDGIVLLRVTPRDRDPHNWGEAGILRLKVDNYQGQKISITLADTRYEYSDSVKINYTIVDTTKDILTIKLLYKTRSSDTFKQGSLAGVTLVDSTKYSGSFYWLSRRDLNGYDGLVKIYIYANDGFSNGIGDSIEIKVDNNEIPSVLISPLVGEFSDSVRIRFNLNDVEGDTLKIIVEYSADSLRWSKAKIIGDTIISKGSYNSSVIWISTDDLPGRDLNVYVRIIPIDKDTGVVGVIKFHLDNNLPPIVSIISFSGEKRKTGAYKDSLTINISVRDSENDTVKLRFLYRATTENSWQNATIIGDSVIIPSGNRSIIWKTTIDLSSQAGLYYFKIVPSDNDVGVADSILVRIDNLGVPVASLLDTLSGELSGDITFRYKIIDEEGDTIKIISEYSTDFGGTWKRATVEGDTLLADSSKYQGRLIWKSRHDLPGVDIDTVLFRIVPYDLNKGIEAVSLAFHLDNNEIPVISGVFAPSGEVSGDCQIKFIYSDAENDTVRFIFKFSEDSINWKSPSIKNLTVKSDTSSLIWETSKDLDNKDLFVYFQVIPFDKDTGAGKIVKIKVDNQTGPILASHSPVNLAFYNDTIRLRFDRKIYASGIVTGVKIYGSATGEHKVRFSSPDSISFLIIPAPHFASSETVTVQIIADSVRDYKGNTFDGNRNGDPEGSPIDDFTLRFVTSIPGDFNLDKKVNIEDLALFRNIWINKIYGKEIGPASGKPPQMIVQPDGKIDFEDLMVFVMNWNWTAQTGGFKLSEKLSEENYDSKDFRKISLADLFKFEKHEIRNKYNRVGDDGKKYATYSVKLNIGIDSIYAGEFVLKYTPEFLKVLGVKDNDIFGSINGGKTIFLSYIDSINGYIVIDFANLGNVGIVDNNLVAKIDFEILKEGKFVGIIAGEVFALSGNKYSVIKNIEINTSPDVPTQFALLQNYPNPFNPNTVIRYHVPKTSRIIIKIYDVIGREITTLVDDYFNPGYYEIVWDSKRKDGIEVSSGVYFYVMSAIDEGKVLFRDVKKMVIVK